MNRFSWIDEILLPVSAAGLTVAWLSLWARWLNAMAAPANALPSPTFSPALMLALMLASAISARLSLRGLGPLPPPEAADRFSRDPGAEARRMILLTGFIGTVAALWLTYGWAFPFGFLRGLLDWGQFISPEFMALIVCGLLWWRGIVLGQSRLPYDELEQTFYGGLVAMVFLLIVNRLTPHLPANEALAAILLYFAVGLSALTLASFERARRQHRAASVQLALNRHWLSTIGGIIVSVLLGGLAVMALLAPESLARLRPVFAALDWVAQPLLFGFAAVVGWLIRPLFEIANWFISLAFRTLRLPELPPELQVSETTLKVMDAILQSRVFQFGSRSIVVLFVALIFIALIAEALRRFHWLTNPDAEEQRDSILSRELLLKQLRNLFRRPASAGGPPLPPYLPLLNSDPRARIRRAYQAMLEWAKRKGWPRAAGQTPVQYAAALIQNQPPAREALAALTHHYQQARYSAEPLEAADAQAAESAVEQITVD